MLIASVAIEWAILPLRLLGFARNCVYPLEEWLLDAFPMQLPQRMRERIQQQLALYNSFGRDGWWRQFSMYRRKNRSVKFPDELRLVIDKDDARLVSLKVVLPHGRRLPVVVHVVKGRVFSLEFGESYRPFRFLRDLPIEDVRFNCSDFSHLQ